MNRQDARDRVVAVLPLIRGCALRLFAPEITTPFLLAAFMSRYLWLATAFFIIAGIAQNVRADDDPAATDARREQPRAVELPKGAFPKAVGFSPDSKTIACGIANGQGVVYFIDTEAGRVTSSLDSGDGGDEVAALGYSPKGDMLVTAERGGKIRLWNVATRELIRTAVDRTLEFHGLSVSPTGDLVATANRDGIVTVWKSDLSERVRSIRIARFGGAEPPFTSDGKAVYAIGPRVIYLWQHETNRTVAERTYGDESMNINEGVYPVSFDVSRGRDIAAIYESDGSLTFVDAATLRTVSKAQVADNAPPVFYGASIRFFADGKGVLVAGGREFCRTFAVDSKLRLSELTVFAAPAPKGHDALDVAISPDSRRAVVKSGKRLWIYSMPDLGK